MSDMPTESNQPPAGAEVSGYAGLEYTKSEHVATVRLNRSEVGNARGRDMGAAMLRVWADIRDDLAKAMSENSCFRPNRSPEKIQNLSPVFAEKPVTEHSRQTYREHVAANWCL